MAHTDLSEIVTETAGPELADQVDLLCKLLNNLLTVLPVPLAQAVLNATFPNLEIFL